MELIFSSVETISTITTVTAKMKIISCLEIKSLTSFVYHKKSKMNLMIIKSVAYGSSLTYMYVQYLIFVIIMTIINNFRNTDALVPVLACQDRVMRVLQVSSQSLAQCNACFAQ